MVDTEFAELLRHTLLTAMHVGAPVLVVAFAVSAVTGLLQAASGIHETAVGLLPRLLIVGLTLVATLPWMLERMVDLFRTAAGGS